MTGTLPLGKTLEQNVPVQDPARLAATLLKQSLAAVGIVVTGRAVTGQTPPETVVLASHLSLPLAQYLPLMNKPSDNLLAESLVRLLSDAGTYDAGHARETPFLKSLGVETEAIALVDGCGVGRRNFVTARAVAQLLVGMHKKADWRVWYDSLPIAGVDGTLKSRMKGTRRRTMSMPKRGHSARCAPSPAMSPAQRQTVCVFPADEQLPRHGPVCGSRAGSICRIPRFPSLKQPGINFIGKSKIYA